MMIQQAIELIIQLKQHVGIFLLLFIGFYVAALVENGGFPSVLRVARAAFIIFCAIELSMWVYYFCFVI